jgi:glycosyltransferase involved in cell wall biosynthesis
MPVYNMQNSVLNAVQSILQQSHENFELLVYDDGSTDNTLEKISSFSIISFSLIILLSS